MRKKDVKIGSVYIVRVSQNLAPVKLLRESTHGGWYGENLITGKSIHLRTAGRLQREIPENKITEVIKIYQDIRKRAKMIRSGF